MEQSELKNRLKEALRISSLNYDWLAEKMGVTKCTVNNYMAKRDIPKAQAENMESILARLEAGDYTIIAESPVKKKRHRRTNEQIRKDKEASIIAGQARIAEDGFIDQEAEEERWRAFGEKCLNQARETFHNAVEEFHTRGLLDMRGSDPAEVNVQPDSMVYRIAIPSEIVSIYRKEVKFLNDGKLPKDVHVTIPMLIARAITEDALAMIESDRPFYYDKLEEWRRKFETMSKAVDAEKEINNNF